MDTVALVAFSGGSSCFPHVLLNAHHMKERGCELRVIFKGQTTARIKEID